MARLPTAIELSALSDASERLVALVEPATRLLEQASSIDDASELRAQAEAIKTYARARSLSQEAIGAAQTIYIRAGMRIGELDEESPGGRGKLSPRGDSLGRDVAHRLRTLADNRELVEELLTNLAPKGEATQTAIISAIKRDQAQFVDDDARNIVPARLDAMETGRGWTVYGGDFRTVLEAIAPESVDIIVTDPPYMAEALDLWADLAIVASRILVPGGILVALSGKISLPEVIQRLRSHLQYGWVYNSPVPGPSTRILARHIAQEWKPWLAFSKGPWPSGRIDWHPDVLDGGPLSKTRYRWEQSDAPAIQLIHFLCPGNGLVIDPFMGTGTYGVAALRAGRRFVGVEVDSERFRRSALRLLGEDSRGS